MRKNTLALVISSMLLATAVQAQTIAPTGSPGMTPEQSNSSDSAAMAQQRWSAADTDRNGTLSKAEMQASMPTGAANFSKMDANGDGQLSQDEMHGSKHAASKAEWSQGFKAADTDRDGSLTQAEAKTGMPMISSHFAAIDTDKNGKVTSQEVAVHHAAMRGPADASMDADKSTRSSTTKTTTETTTDEARPDAGSSH